MSAWEPTGGWNLPPGCFEGDPDAPWNEPDGDPWVGRRCRDCRFLGRLSGGGGGAVCSWAPMTGEGPDVEAVDESDEACEGFEE